MRFPGLDAVLDRPGTFVLDLLLGCWDLVLIYTCSETTTQTPFFSFVIVGFAALKHIFSQVTSTHLFAAYPEVSDVLLSCSNFP